MICVTDLENGHNDINLIRDQIYIPYSEFCFKHNNIINPAIIEAGIIRPSIKSAKLYISDRFLKKYFEPGTLNRNKTAIEVPVIKDKSVLHKFLYEFGLDDLKDIKIIGYPETEEFFMCATELDAQFKLQAGSLENFIVQQQMVENEETEWFSPGIDYYRFPSFSVFSNNEKKSEKTENTEKTETEFYVTPMCLVKFLMIRKKIEEDHSSSEEKNFLDVLTGTNSEKEEKKEESDSDSDDFKEHI